jgi:hypothetical protein
MHIFNLRKTLLASLVSAALAPAAFAQTYSNTNDTAYFWGLDNSGNPLQITGVSAVPFQGNPYTIMYADDNQGTPLNTNNPGTDTANVIVYDGGLGTNNTASTFVKINGGQNNIKVSGTGITINGATNVNGGLSIGGQSVATNASVAAAVAAIDLSPYAQLSGANFTGPVTSSAFVAGTGGIANTGALNVIGLSTLAGGISAGGAGITNAGAISGATSITASGAVAAGSLSSAATLNGTGQ